MNDININNRFIHISKNVSFNPDGSINQSFAVIDLKEFESAVYNESRNSFLFILAGMLFGLAVISYIVYSNVPTLEFMLSLSFVFALIGSVCLLVYYTWRKTICCINGNIYYSGFKDYQDFQNFINAVTKQKTGLGF